MFTADRLFCVQLLVAGNLQEEGERKNPEQKKIARKDVHSGGHCRIFLIRVMLSERVGRCSCGGFIPLVFLALRPINPDTGRGEGATVSWPRMT